MKPSLRLLILGSLAATCLAHADLVQNGSFEDVAYSGSLGFDEPTGWTITPASDGGGSLFVGGPTEIGQGVAAEDGSNYLAFGAAGPALDSISQTFSTISGASYDLSFWVDTDLSAGTPMELTAAWGSDAVLDLTAPLSASGWNEYTYAVTGSGLDTLSFSGFDSNGYTLLDDVQVQAAGASVPDVGPGLLLTAATLLALLAYRRYLPA